MRRKWNGAKWITRQRRLAIYARDGFACFYCGAHITNNVTLSLDHVLPVAAGGGNETKNLITCCRHCNSRKADSIPTNGEMTRIKEQTAKKLDQKLCNSLVKQLGYTAALRFLVAQQ